MKTKLHPNESVAKYYLAMGTGCQAQMNGILATFAQMRMGQVTMENERVQLELRKINEAMKRREL